MKNDNYQYTDKTRDLSYEIIARELFENYESIYDIDMETSRYRCFHESDFYRELNIADEGEDFFASLKVNIPAVICSEDQDYVLSMLDRDALMNGVKKEKYYSLIYRLKKGEKLLFHQIRATLKMENGHEHVLMGVRNIDSMMRRELAHRREIADMRQKERNHMEAILASAIAYMEANLTKDKVIERSLDDAARQQLSAVKLPDAGEANRYSDLHDLILKELIVKNEDKYARIGSIDYLLTCFERGEKRTSVSYSIRTDDGGVQPCKEVFYLYREASTGDIHAFCVIYDLTEQQRKEQEREELERQLELSRIHNSTSQMQPHFLYNALGSIQEIVLTNPEYASDLIGDFTTHLRSCIRTLSHDEPVPFSQELANIRAYVNIEKMRFGEKLKVQYQICEENFRILPLSIQPIVENAIRHGIYERGIHGGCVTIRTADTGRAWLVQVVDDGVGFDVDAFRKDMEKEGQESTGLKNIIFRLDKVMHAKLEIHSEPGRGCEVTVLVPKEDALVESDHR